MRDQSSMSKSERRIADMILADLSWAVKSTTTELAERTGTSTPTITRFCRRLGCDGLRDFKLRLAQATAVGHRYLGPQQVERTPIKAVTSVIGAAHDALERVSGQIDEQALTRAAEWLGGARRIAIFGGGGGSSMVAEEGENRLFRLGLSVHACIDTQLQQMIAATLSPDDVLLTISTSGRYPESLRMVEIARTYGAKTVAITRPGSALAQAVDVLLGVDVPETEEVLKPTASRYGLLAMMDILATELAGRCGEAAVENMRRIKYQLVTHRDTDDTQPLGD
ncbi:MurR/RpiR family transcriptional regulator [Marinobacter nanhaiticus D15-8W]|uniref:MurR/RpiR family transcriptional regulator n=2 Tax=Marinobacter TaxID=2742 RepID=N6WVP3_9GAMM|nr:MurR/RpiR family transcriptional regulator [Marinobacter nanhaiticus D15-8W]